MVGGRQNEVGSCFPLFMPHPSKKRLQKTQETLNSYTVREYTFLNPIIERYSDGIISANEGGSFASTGYNSRKVNIHISLEVLMLYK